MEKIKRILTATDFSEGSNRALDYAIFLAKAFDAELRLVHVLEPPFPTTDPDYLKMFESMAKAEEQKLGALTVELKKRIPDIQSECREGTAATTIVKAAKELNSGLIVLGSHGRTGIAHAFIGSVAERVLRLAHCPVITVRSDEPSDLGLTGATIPIAPTPTPAG